MNTTYLADLLSALLVCALADRFVCYKRSLEASIKRLARMHRQVSGVLERTKGIGHADAQVHVCVAYVYLESAKTLNSIGDKIAARAAAESGYVEIRLARKMLRHRIAECFCLNFGLPRIQ